MSVITYDQSIADLRQDYKLKPTLQASVDDAAQALEKYRSTHPYIFESIDEYQDFSNECDRLQKARDAADRQLREVKHRMNETLARLHRVERFPTDTPIGIGDGLYLTLYRQSEDCFYGTFRTKSEIEADPFQE